MLFPSVLCFNYLLVQSNHSSTSELANYGLEKEIAAVWEGEGGLIQIKAGKGLNFLQISLVARTQNLNEKMSQRGADFECKFKKYTGIS